MAKKPTKMKVPKEPEREAFTLAEYEKASRLGFNQGISACACIGPQGNEIWCPCKVNLLDVLDQKAQKAIIDRWIEENRLLSEAVAAKKKNAIILPTGKVVEEFVYDPDADYGGF